MSASNPSSDLGDGGQADELRRERDVALKERDEMRAAAPDADVAYWQDRCLDHATALDAERIAHQGAARRVEELEAGYRYILGEDVAGWEAHLSPEEVAHFLLKDGER